MYDFYPRALFYHNRKRMRRAKSSLGVQEPGNMQESKRNVAKFGVPFPTAHRRNQTHRREIKELNIPFKKPWEYALGKVCDKFLKAYGSVNIENFNTL